MRFHLASSALGRVKQASIVLDQVEIKRAVKKEEMPMGAAGGGGGYVPGAGGPVRGQKEPDWICPEPNCQNKNFGWRQLCNRCQVRLHHDVWCYY